MDEHHSIQSWKNTEEHHHEKIKPIRISGQRKKKKNDFCPQYEQEEQILFRIHDMFELNQRQAFMDPFCELLLDLFHKFSPCSAFPE